MRNISRGGMICMAISMAGCLGDDAGREPFALRNPFKTERKVEPSGPAASTQVATRVDTVGKAVVAANASELRTKPIFMTLGGDNPMIFHRRSGEIVVSEGLVKRCSSDAELAAALCHEIGKLAAEREDRGTPRQEHDLPPSPRFPPDVVGGGQPADMTGLAEAATYDRRNPRAPRAPREARPDPNVLARNFLTKAGHEADELKRMEPLLKEAEENGEKRDVMKGR
jgi:hypothetical protein